MSTLVNLTTKQVIISRITTVSGYKKAFATTTGAWVEIQPLSPAKTQAYEGAMGKTFICYADPSNSILEGDKLRETLTGNIYKVKTGGVTRRTFGSIDYLSVVMEQIN